MTHDVNTWQRQQKTNGTKKQQTEKNVTGERQ